MRDYLAGLIADRLAAALSVPVDHIPRSAPELRDWNEAAERGILAASMRRRDDAYRDAINLYGGAKTAAVRLLVSDLDRYFAVGWRRKSQLDHLPDSVPAKRRACQILWYNGDRQPLKWRQILYITKS